MTILERIQDDVKASMRARDGERTVALRMLVAALQGEAKARLRTLDEQEEIAVLMRERKKRIEAAVAFDVGGAPDRAGLERSQQQLVEAYLPEQLTVDELHVLVLEAVHETGADSPSQMGLVMKALMPKVQGRADGKVVSQAVQHALASADSARLGRRRSAGASRLPVNEGRDDQC